ncbi:hypothetical protein D3C81_2034800 [compost metagenome]
MSSPISAINGSRLESNCAQVRANSSTLEITAGIYSPGKAEVNTIGAGRGSPPLAILEMKLP